MSDIQYIEGDLLSSREPVIAHGCNAQGVMGSGIAKAIRDEYPTVYKDYRDVYEEQGNKLHLGQVITTRTLERTILNIISQEYYGRNPNVVYVSYDAIEKAILRINKMGYVRVAFPKIGAGLANGNWELISHIIQTTSDFTPVVYYIKEPTEKW
jgi:O-acetyl-ADP-ribose deacetylase (regulator of RNase III)